MNKINNTIIAILIMIAMIGTSSAWANQLNIKLPSVSYVSQPLTVTITNEDTGNAVVGVDIKICATKTHTCISLKSDTHGNATFIPLNIYYEIWASAPGYTPKYNGFQVDNPQYNSKAIIINSKVYIQITDTNNKPVVGATVSEGKWLWFWLYSYNTNLYGLAAFQYNQPGNYNIKISIPGIGIRYATITVPVYEMPRSSTPTPAPSDCWENGGLCSTITPTVTVVTPTINVTSSPTETLTSTPTVTITEGPTVTITSQPTTTLTVPPTSTPIVTPPPPVPELSPLILTLVGLSGLFLVTRFGKK